jgi:hypothetical protein
LLEGGSFLLEGGSFFVYADDDVLNEDWIKYRMVRLHRLLSLYGVCKGCWPHAQPRISRNVCRPTRHCGGGDARKIPKQG